MNRITHYLPLIFFIFLIIGLFTFLDNEESDLRSVLLDKNFPDFSLSKLENQEIVTKNDLVELPSLLNVWATWCPTCKYEHPYLVDIAKNPQVNLYGLNYKDERVAAQKWLKNYEDPYEFSIFDEEGTLGLDLGVYGAPETFVIDHHGTIRKRFAGAIDTY